MTVEPTNNMFLPGVSTTRETIERAKRNEAGGLLDQALTYCREAVPPGEAHTALGSMLWAVETAVPHFEETERREARAEVVRDLYERGVVHVPWVDNGR